MPDDASDLVEPVKRNWDHKWWSMPASTPLAGAIKSLVGVSIVSVLAAVGLVTHRRLFLIVFIGGAAGLFLIRVARRRSAASLFGVVFGGLVIVELVPGLAHRSTGQLAVLALAAMFAGGAAMLTTSGGWRGLSLAWLVIIGFLTLITGGIGHHDANGSVFGFTLALLMAGGIAAGRSTSALDRDAVFRGLVVFAGLCAAIAIVEWARQRPLFDYSPYQHLSPVGQPLRPAALLAHPLVLGTLLSSVAMSSRLGRRRGWRAGLLRAGVPLAGVLVTLSRTGLLIVFTGAVVTAALHGAKKRSKKMFLMPAGAILAVAVLASFAPGSTVAQRLRSLNPQHQAGRIGSLGYANAVTHGSAVLVGNGPKWLAESFASRHAVYKPNKNLTALDNQAATMYTEWGLVGLALLLTTIARLLWAVRKPTNDERPLVFALCLAASFIAFDTLYWPEMALLFAWATGAAIQIVETGEDTVCRSQLQAPQYSIGSRGPRTEHLVTSGSSILRVD